MTSIIRFAIAGNGNIGRRHATHILQNPSASLVAISDNNAARSAGVAEGVDFYLSIDDMLQAGGFDVLCV
ncbi:MAG: gfo/Idh/MocA family oxidoreductase, partial [Chitinophagia bacterium]|nr:gfo/Idh/MocA family oxidoreductase [Chitinophagia bacterium]